MFTVSTRHLLNEVWHVVIDLHPVTGKENVNVGLCSPELLNEHGECPWGLLATHQLTAEHIAEVDRQLQKEFASGVTDDVGDSSDRGHDAGDSSGP